LTNILKVKKIQIATFLQRLEFGVLGAWFIVLGHVNPQLYRQPKLMVLLLLLLFAALAGLCWYSYRKQLQDLDNHLEDLRPQIAAEMNSFLPP
jgi:hypothetical protein